LDFLRGRYLVGAFDLDRIAIEFPGATPAEAAIIAQECARLLQEAGVHAAQITVARSDKDAMDLGGALVVLGGLGFTFIQGAVKGAGEAVGRAAGRIVVEAVRDLPSGIQGTLEAASKRHRTPVRVTGLGDRTWTIGGEFARAPLAPGAESGAGPGLGTLGIVILGASEFPYMNDASLNNPALARSAQLAKSLFSPPNTAFAGTAVLDLFDSEKSPVDVLDAIERHIDAHPDMRDLLIYYCGHGSFHDDDTYFLLLRSTRADRAMMTGFAPRALRGDLMEKRLLNKRVYFVVDACFSGAMVGSMLTTTLDRTVRDHLTLDMPQRGWSVLTASSKDKVARAPEGTTYTMFTGALAHVIERGVGAAGVRFNLYDLCEEARFYVKDRWGRQAVEPQCFSKQEDGDIGRLPLFLNRGRAGAGAAKSAAPESAGYGQGRAGGAASAARPQQRAEQPTATPDWTRPAHPLEGLWYVEGDADVEGPYKGFAIKRMIEQGRLGATSAVVEDGTKAWIRLADSPVFAPYLRSEGTAAGATDQYAGFWIRMLAGLIDVALLLLTAAVVGTIFYNMSCCYWYERERWATAGVIGTVLFYHVFFPAVLQATPGKWICGLRVIRADGGRVEPLRALLRFLSYVISALPLGFGFFLMESKDQRMAWHDMICGTRVVHASNAASRFWNWWRRSR
jgi:uncharacterized RDD family membrane protein YckC